MSRVKKIINDLSELYKKLLYSTSKLGSNMPARKTGKKQESIEETNSVDFLLNDLERQAEENRQKIADLGFWTEQG